MVFTVHWQCNGVDEVNGVTYSGSVYSTCYVPYNPDAHWVDYANLTKDEVMEWMFENGVDQAATEAAVQQQIDNQINPPVISPPIPWETV